jgi:hypothetical protein
MTGETSEGARRVRVVPRPAPGAPPVGGAPNSAAPYPAAPKPSASQRPGGVEAETEVLPRVAPGSAPAPAGGPGRTPGAAAGPPPAPREAPRRRGAPVDPEPTDGGEPPEAPERRFGLGAPALVLGVLAAGTCWTGWAGVVLGLFAVAAGYLGARRAFKGLATDGAASLGGLALGAVGLVVGLVVVWPTLFGTGNFGDGLTLDQCLQQANGAFQMHMCKSQHIAEFNQRFPNAAT